MRDKETTWQTLLLHFAEGGIENITAGFLCLEEINSNGGGAEHGIVATDFQLHIK